MAPFISTVYDPGKLTINAPSSDVGDVVYRVHIGDDVNIHAGRDINLGNVLKGGTLKSDRRQRCESEDL